MSQVQNGNNCTPDADMSYTSGTDYPPSSSHVMVWHGSSVSGRAPGLRRWLVMSWHFYAIHLHLGLSVKV